jgi:hypothetical protein
MSDLERLRSLADALNASTIAIRRDEYSDRGPDDGDHGLFGRAGQVYVDGPGYWLYVNAGDSQRRWTNIKRSLGVFCDLMNDGDAEGAFRLDRMPTPGEADAIRDALGIRKRRNLSEATIAAMTERLPRPIIRPLAA